MYYAKACNEFAGPHFPVIAPAGNTAPFEEMPQHWRAIGNTMSDLTGPRFEPQTFRFRATTFGACIKSLLFLLSYYITISLICMHRFFQLIKHASTRNNFNYFVYDLLGNLTAKTANSGTTSGRIRRNIIKTCIDGFHAEPSALKRQCEASTVG